MDYKIIKLSCPLFMATLQCSVFKNKSVIKCHEFPWAKMQDLSLLADLKNLVFYFNQSLDCCHISYA